MGMTTSYDTRRMPRGERLEIGDAARRCGRSIAWLRADAKLNTYYELGRRWVMVEDLISRGHMQRTKNWRELLTEDRAEDDPRDG